ncbi:MAG: FtsX-like permease family protein [Candidatus Latescibacterota bacterium]|nr:MAG: FtsX-like permease family protein [Candidatus Latescibacterota bacterium]
MTLEGIRIALAALRENKLRTFLTLLGNIVGTMAVIAVVSLIAGIDRYAREEIAAEGSNVVTLNQFDFFELLTDFDAFLEAIRRNPEIDLDDYAFLEERVTTALASDALLQRRAAVRAGARSVGNAAVQGRTESFGSIENVRIAAGRGLSPLEVRRARPVAVIGTEIAESLFPDQDPLGRTIKIGSRHFRVIGVGEPRASQLGESRNRFVITPITSYRKMYGRDESLSIKFRAEGAEEVERLQGEIRHAMRLRHRLKPSEEDDFALTTSERVLDLWEKISAAIFRALIGLVSISLVVGGVVLMNVMLVAVTERTHEIGIRKAIGATRRHILTQFLAESVTLSVVGGTLGVFFGFVIAATIAGFTPVPYAVKAWAIAAGLGVTFVIGVAFGTYPAARASRLDPIEALRHD